MNKKYFLLTTFASPVKQDHQLEAEQSEMKVDAKLFGGLGNKGHEKNGSSKELVQNREVGIYSFNAKKLLEEARSCKLLGDEMKENYKVPTS